MFVTNDYSTGPLKTIQIGTIDLAAVVYAFNRPGRLERAEVFGAKNELKYAVTLVVRGSRIEWYNYIYTQLVKRGRKFIEYSGDYFEKT